MALCIKVDEPRYARELGYADNHARHIALAEDRVRSRDITWKELNDSVMIARLIAIQDRAR